MVRRHEGLQFESLLKSKSLMPWLHDGLLLPVELRKCCLTIHSTQVLAYRGKFMTFLKNVLATIASFASLFSGLFWHLSAKAAADSATATGTTPAALQAARDLASLSIHQNIWAAYAASVAGVALAIALILDINTKPQTCNCKCASNSPAAS